MWWQWVGVGCVQGGNALCHRGPRTSQAPGCLEQLAACHPGGRGWDTIIIIIVIIIFISAGNKSAAAVLGPGELPFPSLGCLEQQGGRKNPIPYFEFACCCSPSALTWLCFSPGLWRAAKLSSDDAAKKPLCEFVFPVTNSWDKTCKVETRAAFTFAFFFRNWQEIKRKLKHPWAGFCGRQRPVRQDASGFGRCLFPAGNWRREPTPGNRALHNAPPNQRVCFQLSWCFMLTCAWFTYYCEVVITVIHFFLKL